MWPEYEKQKNKLEKDASVSKYIASYPGSPLQGRSLGTRLQVHAQNISNGSFQQYIFSCAEFLDGSGSLKFLVQEAEAFMRSCIQQLTATDQPSS